MLLLYPQIQELRFSPKDILTPGIHSRLVIRMYVTTEHVFQFVESNYLSYIRFSISRC